MQSKSDATPAIWRPLANPIPNWDKRRAIDSIDASELDFATLRDEYWSRNRPLHIRGAVRHMEAFRAWQDIDYVRKKAGEETLLTFSRPIIEDRPAEGETRVGVMAVDKVEGTLDALSVPEFLDRVSDRSAPPIWAYATPLRGPDERAGEKRGSRPDDPDLARLWEKLTTDYPLTALRGDLGQFNFLENPGDSRIYAQWRLFIYRQSFTDWHAHPSDAHLMCQFRGGKYVALVPPNEGAEKIAPVITAWRHTFRADPDTENEFFEIEPYGVHVEPGDALYIPIYWWHNVVPSDSDWGITGAYTWPSPIHVNGDWHYRWTRRNWEHLDTFSPMRLAVLAARAYSSAYRAFRRATAPNDDWEWRV